MKNQKLSERNTADLKKYEKSIKTITGILLGMLLVLFMLSLYITFTKGFTALLIIPITLMPIVILNFNTINEIKKELKSRIEN
ncbi:redox-active disulfide protein 2 [Flavobacterium branchiophilum]|uniref:Redox-active disulfide protein 2 n=1 Tax=Flavobacterium branchiophilum TaxID=55197 RepID=A0A2H3KDW7_9FLAO|nr:redox-active disulfide protein 2 [Flavobacterium branchiophilum]PDS26255.1 redox-active disulfide protein 2 [Flavobacterium branchiophilum]